MLSACAFAEGQPWGVADLSLSARVGSTAGRRTAEGRIKTNEDYAIELHRLALRVESAHLDVIPAGGGPTSFDPANPPPGFSLCHNGHCHADSGGLVSYQDIERQLSGGGAGGFSVVRPSLEGEVEIAEEPVAIPLGPCTAECELVRGEMSSASVDVSELSFEITVFDLRPERRIDGARFVATAPVEVELSESIDGKIDDGEEIGVRAQMTVVVPESLFDSIDWAAASTTAETLDRIAENLFESEALVVEIERFAEEP